MAGRTRNVIMIDKIREWLNTPSKEVFTRQDFFKILLLGIAMGICAVMLINS